MTTEEIKITPEMIQAGLRFLEERGIVALTTEASYLEFVIDFLTSTSREQLYSFY